MKTKRMCIALAAVLACMVLVSCGSDLWSTAEHAMDRAAERGDYQKAVEIGLSYLEKDAGEAPAEAYIKLADLYANELGDSESSAAMLSRGMSALPDEERADVANYWLEILEKDGTLNALRTTLPSRNSFTLNGRLLTDWTMQELRDWLPVSEQTYENGGSDEPDWDFSEEYQNYSVMVSNNVYASSASYSVDISALSRAATDYYSVAGPEIMLPDGISVGMSKRTLLTEVLGTEPALTDLLSQCANVYLTVGRDNVSVWTSDSYDAEWSNLEVDYDGANSSDNVRFSFKNDKLDGYELFHSSYDG